METTTGCINKVCLATGVELFCHQRNRFYGMHEHNMSAAMTPRLATSHRYPHCPPCTCLSASVRPPQVLWTLGSRGIGCTVCVPTMASWVWRLNWAPQSLPIQKSSAGLESLFEPLLCLSVCFRPTSEASQHCQRPIKLSWCHSFS